MNLNVELFTTSNCQNCKIAKMILEQYGINYIEKNIETNQEYEKEFVEKLKDKNMFQL